MEPSGAIFDALTPRDPPPSQKRLREGRGRVPLPEGKRVFGRGKKDIVRPPAPRGLVGFMHLFALPGAPVGQVRAPFWTGEGPIGQVRCGLGIDGQMKIRPRDVTERSRFERGVTLHPCSRQERSRNSRKQRSKTAANSR